MEDKHGLLLSSIFASLCMVGCGGSSSNDAPIVTPPVTPPVAATWVENTFEDDSKFAQLCEAPRTGTNPETNSAYLDRQGTLTDEKFWMRSWSNDTYLWYDEVIDRDPANFTVAAYFDQLKTNQTDANGAPKDNFHFNLATTEWLKQTQSGTSLSYGAKLKIVSATPPRQVLIAYTEPDSPATRANLVRGDEIVAINGVSVVNAADSASVDIINAGLFPSIENKAYTFTVKSIETGEQKDVIMGAQNVTSTPVQNVKVIPTTSGKVGYLQFNSHIATAELALKNAVDTLAAENISDLVLDLRYNGGGLLAIASQLSYMVTGDTITQDKVFEKTSFNDKYPATNPVTGQTLQPFPFIDVGLGFSVAQNTPLPSLGLNRVFVLSTDNTCSASEAIINGLRGIDVEVVLIGGTTCGKPYGFYPTDNCGTTYFTIQFKGENDKGFGEYASGFAPSNTPVTDGVSVTGCAIEDDFTHALGDPLESQLAAALSYRSSSICPAISGSKAFINRMAMIDSIDKALQIKDKRISTALGNSRNILLPHN